MSRTTSWALYDFANSAFTTLIVTFIFGPWFTQNVASDPDAGSIFWTRALNVSALIVAISTPLLGAIADESGRRKRFLMIATVVCALGTAALWFVQPGDVVFALAAFVIANTAFEAGIVFYNAFLPDVSTPENIGRVSGFGMALGYVGGLICLGIALWLIMGQGTHLIRATYLLVAVWVVAFALPMFILVPESEKRSELSVGEATMAGFRSLVETFRHLRQLRHAFRLIIARLIYNDGLVTVFGLASIFAGITFGLETQDIIILGIALNVAAGIGSWLMGKVHDRIGGKKTIAITLVLLFLATAIGVSFDLRVFWVCAIVIGAMVGPNQAASRGLLSELVPDHKQGEFFGLFAFSGKITSFLGPLTYGLVVGATGSQRWAMGSIAVFFLVGLALLGRVNEEEGIAMKRQGAGI